MAWTGTRYAVAALGDALGIDLRSLHPDTQLRTTETARALRRHPSTLDRWAARGTGPKWTRHGRQRDYRAGDVLYYLENGEEEG